MLDKGSSNVQEFVNGHGVLLVGWESQPEHPEYARFWKEATAQALGYKGIVEVLPAKLSRSSELGIVRAFLG